MVFELTERGHRLVPYQLDILQFKPALLAECDFEPDLIASDQVVLSKNILGWILVFHKRIDAISIPKLKAQINRKVPNWYKYFCNEHITQYTFFFLV